MPTYSSSTDPVATARGTDSVAALGEYGHEVSAENIGSVSGLRFCDSEGIADDQIDRLSPPHGNDLGKSGV